MSQQPSTLNASGWTLAVGASSSASATSESPDVYVIYKGQAFDRKAFDRPGRGIIAAVARGIGAGPRAREAAHIALHGLLEGYFGAAATLGPGVPPVSLWEAPTPGCSASPAPIPGTAWRLR